MQPLYSSHFIGIAKILGKHIRGNSPIVKSMCDYLAQTNHAFSEEKFKSQVNQTFLQLHSNEDTNYEKENGEDK